MAEALNAWIGARRKEAARTLGAPLPKKEAETVSGVLLLKVLMQELFADGARIYCRRSWDLGDSPACLSQRALTAQNLITNWSTGFAIELLGYGSDGSGRGGSSSAPGSS